MQRIVKNIREQTKAKARHAKREALILLPLLFGVIIAYQYRDNLFGTRFDLPIRVISVIALVVLGWAFARDLGRALGPALFKRVDPGTAGVVGFVIRLSTLLITLLVALKIAGIQPRTLALGGAITAVIFGLAAQQTLGNLIAGTVLLSARPFRVGERIRLHAGGVAGQLEGTVASLGLLYTILHEHGESILIPNNVVLAAAVIPLKDPGELNLVARLQAGVKPSQVHKLLESSITIKTLVPPYIELEEIDGEEVTVRIHATPEAKEDGPRLADEVIAMLAIVTRGEHQEIDTEEFDLIRAGLQEPPKT